MNGLGLRADRDVPKLCYAHFYAQVAIDFVIYIVIWCSCLILFLPCLGPGVLILKGFCLPISGECSGRVWVIFCPLTDSQ